MERDTTPLEIRLLGGFRVSSGDRPIPANAWRQKRAADIVKLLALAPRQRLHREQVCDALWPDLDPDAAANNLRVALHRARQRLEQAGAAPGTYLTRDGENLILAPGGAARVDVDEFERAATAAWQATDPAVSERAIALYAGELLPENRYEEWVESRRAALRASFLTLLARIAQLYEQRGELGRAIAVLERIAPAEPLAEELHLALVRLLALTGQRRQAMETAVRLVKSLRSELGAEPQPVTRDLVLAIRDRQFPEQVLPLEPGRSAAAARQIPSGTVTFLFATIRAADGNAHAITVDDPDQIFRRLVERHGGQVLDVTGDGDVKAARFPRAASALAAALDAHRECGTAEVDTPLAVRFALHSGDLPADEGGGGAPYQIPAALLAAGHDGQILLSRATQELVRSSLPPGIELRDLGEHHLPAILDAQRVFQAAGRGLHADFPPLRTPQGRWGSLPAMIDGLIGRKRELAELTNLLGGKRLVTLTGPGGVGKSRLALAVAAATADIFPDGAALVELAPVQTPTLIVPTIARALGVQESEAIPLLDAIAVAVGDNRLLVVVDNCEHLADVAAPLATLLARCPRLAVLATSRARLRIRGEQEYPVSPLGFPEFEPALSGALPNQTGEPAAVTLFVERARAARPDFSSTSESMSTIGALVRRLDGLPLAIELAAARVRILSPAELLVRLARPLDILTGGPGDAPERHRTLRATIAWSVDLLSAEERVCFARLAVFAGGFTSDAFIEVAGGRGDLDTLESLVDQSLVVERRQRNGELRFDLLETIREFAREQLAASGEDVPVRDNHAAFFLELAERAWEEFEGPDEAIWMERLDVELANLRGALGWLLQSDAAERALRLAGWLWWFWWVRGHLSEGRSWLEQTLSIAGDATAGSRARALFGAGALAEAQGDYDQAVGWHEEALALYRSAGDQEGIADALASLGQMARDQGEYERAVLLLDEALTICRAADDQRGAAYILIDLGTVASYRGGTDLALPLYTEALSMLRNMNDPRGYAAALTNVASMIFAHGDPERAAPLYEEARQRWRDLGDEPGRATALTNLGEIAQNGGDLERAVAFYREALPVFQQAGDRRNAAAVLANLGQVARERGELAEAATLLAGSAEVFSAIGDKEAMARSLEALAGLAVALGESVLGARLFGRAAALRDEIGAPLAIIAADQYERDVAATRALLPDADFAAAWALGRLLPLAEAIREAQQIAPGASADALAATGAMAEPRLLEILER